MKTLTVLVDTREQRPLMFPATLSLFGRPTALQSKRRKLATGDYALVGAEQIALIERKAGVRELQKNLLTRDKRRTRRALDRLAAEAKYPILLLESNVQSLLLPTKHVPEPGPVLQHLFNECAQRGIAVVLVGECKFPTKRRLVGELAVRLMAAYARQALGTDWP